jgi:hypothetical protein
MILVQNLLGIVYTFGKTGLNSEKIEKKQNINIKQQTK